MTTRNELDDVRGVADPHAAEPHVTDHHIQQLEVLRDIKSELQNFNRDMDDLRMLTEQQVVATVQTRKITSWTAVAVIPGSLGSLYGSNFTHMPELEYTWAWPAFLGGLAAAAFTVFVLMKRRGWL
ncbi:CorA family divalent cation transporter [Streptomyces sp. NPDC048669]|uniref:CorA family divalent cation transporter n=1 Tax=Streptomyces sp. NPDC048669 TaxID=3155267 RepID=UPI003437036C